MIETLNTIVKGLKNMVGEEDMASVQINTDGKCILRLGCTYSNHLSIDEFVKEIENAV